MKYAKSLICIILLTIVTFTESVVMVHAEENEKAVSQSVEGLGLSIDYPSEIKCGEAVTFTMNGTGGSGNYKYRIYDLFVNDGSEWVSVYDVSYGSNGSYKESNTFTFTFYASGTYYIRFGVFDVNSRQTYSTGLFAYPLTIQDKNYPSVEEIVNTVAAQCQAECTTDFEKAVWLHDWIINHGDYDYTYSYSSAEGVLARGRGTCESYHRAYVMLLNKVGIETGRIVGNGHVWTAVKIDDEWYQVDTTWDDMGASYKGTYYEHMYFGLTDYITGLIHSDHKEAVAGYESVSLANNYFIQTGEIKQWSDPFIDPIKENIAGGQMNFTLAVNSDMPDNYKNVIYNLVAYQLSNQDWEDMELTVSYVDNRLNCIAEKTEIDEGEKKTQTVYNGVDYSSVYDFEFYVNNNPDLKRAYGTDDYAALQHFVEHGMTEGRQASEEFNVYTYRNRYVDLRRGYKDDLKGYYMHYIQAGKAEGRLGSGEVQFVGDTIYNGVDYVAVYNYDYYCSQNPDLRDGFGKDEQSLLWHFVEYGMSEGRVASEEFNVRAYMSRYDDLQAGYGSDLKSYYIHYMQAGRAEGRDGSPYDSDDYAAVYNFETYMKMNADLQSVFGNNPKEALAHFVEHGMAEGRRASDEFSVHVYRNRYEDLRVGYGNNLKGYYMHYIQAGQAEGRSAI